MTHFLPGETIMTREEITAVCILPIVSTKRSDNGAPEATVVVLGLSSGSVLFYHSNGTLLIEQLLHQEAVRTISFRPFSRRQPLTALSIVYDSAIVDIDGAELHQSLRVARVSPEVTKVTSRSTLLD